MQKVAAEHYLQIHKMCDDIPTDFFPLLTSEEKVLKLLYLWDLTANDAGNTLNVIDYEQLIYFELLFKKNEKIQQLISNIKANTYSKYVLKHKYIKRLTDDLCKDHLERYSADANDFCQLFLD